MIRKVDIHIVSLLGSLLIMGGFFILRIKTLPPQVPLFYSLTEGDEQMGDTFWLILLPFLMIIFVLANKYIIHRYFREKILAERIIYYANLLIIIFTTFIFLRIILLVT